jgi:Predicted amidophosphoribosyltransferases
MSFFDIFYPTKCILCGKITNDKGICESCGDQLNGAAALSHRIITVGKLEIPCYSLYEYKNATVKKLVVYLKKHNNKKIYEYLAQKFCCIIQKDLNQFNNACVTFVPRTKSSLQTNGFDQAELLAKETAKALKSASFQKLLRRKSHTSEQKFLSRQEREKNAKNMVTLRSKNALPKSVILMDDVITTGSTAKACVNELVQNGTENIVCLFISETALR